MENKNLLLKLIDEYRNLIINSSDYVLSMSVLDKLNAFCTEGNNGEIKVDFEVIGNITEEELKVFSVDSMRIIAALLLLSSKSGWRIETVKKLIKKLEEDIMANKTDKFLKEKDSFDKLYKIIENELYLDNYMLIFEFINSSVEAGMLSLKDAISLNFYLLRECSVKGKTYNDLDIEIAKVQNEEDHDEMIDAMRYIFYVNGYEYDENKLEELEDKFLKYVDFDYVSYVLAMFKKYNVEDSDLYTRIRTFYCIIIDNDKETFNAILKFVDENNCNLKTLLAIPSIFSKKKRRYRERNRTNNGDDYERDLFEICGAQQDFFENIELYKKLNGIDNIDDVQFIGLSKFLCTPSLVVNRNLQLLRLYKIVDKDKFPKSVVSLCGNSVEYLIDRYIETGLYEQYLASRYSTSGEQKAPRGTSYLDRDSNPFRFYKLKLAISLGYNVFASNKGIQKIFYDDSASYMGLSLETLENGTQQIVQKPFEIDRKIPFSTDGSISAFEFFYDYKVINPISIFESSSNLSSKIKGERINGVFSNDYKNVLTNDEIKELENDPIITMLDNCVCVNSSGEASDAKVSDIRYEFTHASLPDVKVIISRYKVLRLCKLLKLDGIWINNLANEDVLNIILCVLLKDTIVSDAEIGVLKLNISEMLINNLAQEKKRKRS